METKPHISGIYIKQLTGYDDTTTPDISPRKYVNNGWTVWRNCYMQHYLYENKYIQVEYSSLM